jgi:hypothetical protein
VKVLEIEDLIIILIREESDLEINRGTNFLYGLFGGLALALSFTLALAFFKGYLFLLSWRSLSHQAPGRRQS